MDIVQTFLNLTNRTYPHGTEHLLEDQLPSDIKQDRFGNYFYQVGEDSRVIFASHLDTVSGEYKDIIHTFDKKGGIVGTDGTTTLGADDKAGVTIMLYMIENKVHGLYYFFIGEEVGCIGSNKVSSQTQIFNKENYDKVISFDRRGNTSVITHQSKMRCCSEDFAETLCDELNSHGLGMETDSTGVCTDSLEFINDIPECTNVSVGYLDEHTFEETQDLDFLERVAKACIKVDWESLPTKRDPSIIEKKKKKKTTYTNTTSARSSRIRKNHNMDMDHYACAYNNISAPYEGHNPMNDPVINGEFGPFEDDNEDDDIRLLDQYGNPIRDKWRGDSLIKHRNVFFDNIDDDAKIESEVEEEEMKMKYFDNIKDKYLNNEIDEKEVEEIKDQLLDSTDPTDEMFIEEMERLIKIKNQFGIN